MDNNHRREQRKRNWNGELFSRSKLRGRSDRNDDDCESDVHGESGCAGVQLCALREQRNLYGGGVKRERGSERWGGMRLDGDEQRGVDNDYIRSKRERQWGGQLLSPGQQRGGSGGDDDDSGAGIHGQSRGCIVYVHAIGRGTVICGGRWKWERWSDDWGGMQLDGDEQRGVDNDHVGWERDREWNGELCGGEQQRSRSYGDNDDRGPDVHGIRGRSEWRRMRLGSMVAAGGDGHPNRRNVQRQCN